MSGLRTIQRQLYTRARRVKMSPKENIHSSWSSEQILGFRIAWGSMVDNLRFWQGFRKGLESSPDSLRP